MLIDNYEVPVDIEEELEPYLEQFNQYRVRGNKLQSCSPFRSEAHPSFAVNLETGTFIDSGSSDEYYHKGNFIKLLAYLQGVTYGEAEEYLLTKYRMMQEDTDTLQLKVMLEPKVTEYAPVDLSAYAFRHPYLAGRGISDQVQRAFQVGYDKKGKAITLVWHDKNGTPINLKYRSVTDKRFWYMAGGQPIKKHVYGLHFIHRMKQRTAFVVESEIDALYLWTHKVPAIALGSASLSKEQERLILNSPIETLVLAFDRDTAGNRAKQDVSRRLMGKVTLQELPIPSNCKDVNDIPSDRLKAVVSSVTDVYPKFL